MEEKFVEVNHFGAGYSDNEEFRIKNMNFFLYRGEVLGIIGKNGAGKTTLLKSLVGLKAGNEGEICIDGYTFESNSRRIKEMIGYVSSEWMYDLTTKLKTLAKYLGSYYEGFSYEKFKELCKRFNVNIETAPMFLSSGEKMVFALVFALSHNARLLVMDEPMVSLDPVRREEIMELLREVMENGETSIIYSTHMIHELERIADRILYMNRGQQKLFMDVNQIQDKYFKGRKVNLEELFEYKELNEDVEANVYDENVFE